MKYSNTVEYNIKTSLDSKGLTQLKSELQGLELKLQNMGNKGFLDEKTFVDARNQIQGLGQALSDAFNPSLGMLDLSKLNQELKNNDVTAQGLKTAFSSLGAEGQVAFNNLVGELGKLDTGILRTNSQIDKLFTTFSNTFRWGLVSSFFSQFMNAIHSSVDYVKELDDSLTQIMLVTDYNRDSMNEFAKSANEAAKAVSMTTTGMTNASLIFAQQGYDLGQSQELATLSAKLANASQQDTATTSDQITAYMNAYGLQDSIEELTQQMDNWALIANVSAADVSELAQASQRAASMANTVGVSGEQLAAQIATIESVTREAPEQIGNGLKTLYARFSDISMGGQDEEGVDLGDVTKQLNDIGVQILDKFGNIRDVGDIMEDLMYIWDDLDQTSKIAAAQSLAGKYQVNRFVSLMDNSDMYREYLGATGSSAAGTLDQMNEEFANSIEGRSAKLQASLEGLFSTIFNTDDIYPWMDAAQGAVDLLQQFFDALGGGKTVLLGISSLLMQVFSKNMAQEINNAATNRAVQQQKLENLQNSQAALTTLGAANPNPNDANSQNILNFAQYMQANAKNFNAEQMNQANSILQELVQNSNAATMAADKLKDSLSVIGTGITATTGESILAPFLDSEGAVNATLLSEALQNMSQSEVADMFSHIQEDIKPAREGLLEFNKALQNYQQELRNVNSTDDSWSKSLANLQAALDHLKGKIDPSTYERYDQAIEEISQVTGNAGDRTAETTAEVAKLADGLERIAAKDLTNLDQLNKDAFQAKNTQMAAEDSNKVAGAFQEGMGSQAHIQNLLNTFNAVQQLTFAWQAFQNLGSLWANEDLSTGEKVLQTIMNLTMAMPQLISALQSIKETQIFDSIGNLFSTIPEIGNAANIQGIQQLLEMQDKGVEAYDKMMEAVGEGAEIADGLEDVWKAGEKATETLGSMDQGLVELVKNGDAVETELTGVAKIFADGMAAAMAEGATGAGLFAGGLKAVGIAAAEALIPLLPYLAIGAAIAGIAFVIAQEAEKAQKAKEEALEAFDEAQSKLEEMQTLQEKVSNFQINFESKKSEGKGFEGLADEARDLADALKEAGYASESADIRLAATKAAALGTEKAYQELTDTVRTASLQATMDTNTDAQRAAMAVLDTQKADLDEIVQKQATLRDLKEELNSLDQEDSKRGILENRIKELEEFIAENQEAVEAVNQLREAQAANVGLQLSQQTSDMVHSSGIDDATKRAGTYSEYAGTYDYDTLNEIYSKNVADWDKYSELEKIDIMLHTLQDDAQIAAVEIEQILQTNSSIKDMGYAGQSLTADEQRDNITGALENTGLSAEQNLQLMATFDKDATYKEIMDGIAEVQQGIENGEDFDVLLKAKFDPEQIAQGVKDAINTYEPTDEDVDADAFKDMANYIQGADASAFEEGGMLEDVSSDIQNNAEALEDLVEGILRYDDAVSTLNDNEEKWRDALSDSADLQDRAEAVAELKETYSDFLDLGADVSDQFAEDANNLDLMKEAAEGSTQAYNDLLAAAATDIAVNVYGVKEGSDELAAMATYLQSGAFQDVEVGMSINDQAFYDALNKMSANANWTAADMEAFLSDIGCSIDPSGFEETANSLIEAADQTGKAEAENLEVTSTTTIDSQTGQETDTTEYTSAIANVTSIEGKSILPVTAGNLGTLSGGAQPTPVEIPYSVPSVEYTAVPITQTDVQEKTGYAVNTEAKQGGGGKSGVQVKKGSVKKSNSGGTKNRGASSPHISSGGGGGGGGRGCFIAGTLVTTQTSFKPIEQIQKGDIVLSYNEKLKINEYSEVVQTMIHNLIEPIYTLYIKDEQLRVTGIHRFLITNKITCGTTKWIPAAELKVGDWVLFADGTWHVIWKIEINLEHQIVYNFEVSGNHNYYVGHNQILAHNKGGKKGGGGGGGGKKTPKEKKPKEINPKEKKQHEKDYYEEVNSQLDKTEKILSKIEKEEDRLIGDKARANQTRQLKLLEKEIALNEKKWKIQKRELADVDARIKKENNLAEKTAKKGGVIAAIPDAVYDEDGVIRNYEQISKAIDAIHNKLIKKYNDAAAAGNEELTKQIEKTISKFDEYGKSILKGAQRHDKLKAEIEATVGTLEDLEDQIEDIWIATFKTHQEAMDDLTDLRENAAELNTLFRDFDEKGFLTGWSLDTTPIDDMTEAMYNLGHAYGMTKENAKSFYQDLINQEKAKLKNTKDKNERAAIESTIGYFQEQKDNVRSKSLKNGELGMWIDEMNRIEGWINGTSKEYNPFGENEAAMWEAYREAYDHAFEAFKKQREETKKLRDSIVDAWDAQNEALEENLDQFDKISDHLERIGNTYALYYGEDSYDGILKIMDQQEVNLEAQYDKLKDAYAYWAKQYNKAVKNGDKELIKETRKYMDEAEEAMYDKAEELAEHWVEHYEKAVDASIQKIENKLWGTTGKDKKGNYVLGLEDQTMAWELQKDYIESYRDDIEKAYEVDKLRSKYIDLLNNASDMSLAIQNKIKVQMQEQLELLENQGTVSEYDVKLANAKLEILQKQIALEDAQRNKNKMQLRRDTQGNYRYVYRADEGEVQKAQDELNESQYDAYEMTKEQTIANNDRAVSLYQDYMNKMRDIANKYKDDQDARNAAMAALTLEYNKLLKALEEDFQDTTNGMYDILCWMVENSTENTSTNAVNMLDQLYDKNGEVKEKTGNDWRDFASQITKEVLPNINEAVAEGIANISDNAEDLKKRLVGKNGIMTDIGSSTDQLKDSMKSATQQTNEWKESVKDLFRAFTEDNEDVQKAMDKLKAMEKQLKTNQKATSSLAEKYKESQKLLEAKTAESLNYRVKAGEKNIKVGDIYTLKKGTEIFYDNYGSKQRDEDGSFSYVLPEDVKVKIQEDQSPAPLQWAMYPTDTKKWGKQLPESAPPETRKQQGWHLSAAALRKAIKADTGGYTGNWTEATSEEKNGKLAFLHKKELILNAKDTENILAAVQMIRTLTTGMEQNFGGSFNQMAQTAMGPTIKQRVEIQATFPNATDADDIRRALINLSDNAYQYSYRTR